MIEYNQTEETKDTRYNLDRQVISEIIEEYWAVRGRMDEERSKKSRYDLREELRRPEIASKAPLSLDSFRGLQKKLVDNYRDYIKYAVNAVFRQGYTKYRKGTLLCLSEDFEPAKEVGSMNDVIQGCEINFYGDEFEFRFNSIRGCSVRYLEESGNKYIELGSNDLSCLSTYAFFAISHNELGFLYDAIIDFVSKVLPFNLGEVQLAGYDEVVDRCEHIISYDNPLTMKRNILLAGPPGCGKSMIIKKVVQNHPEFVRCNLTKTTDWLSWLRLFSEVLSNCDRKLLVVIDEIDELGLSRDIEGSQVYELLRLMDGAANLRNLIIIASTNRLDDLDAALLRPGRFGPVIPVLEPSLEQKREIIDFYGKRYGADLDADIIIGSVKGGFSGADIRVSVEECLIQNMDVSNENICHNLGALIDV